MRPQRSGIVSVCTSGTALLQHRLRCPSKASALLRWTENRLFSNVKPLIRKPHLHFLVHRDIVWHIIGFFKVKTMKKIAFVVIFVLISFIAEAKKVKVLVDDYDNPWFQSDAPVKKFKTVPVPPKHLETKMDNEKIKIPHDPKKKENLRSEWKFLLVRPKSTPYNTKQIIEKEIKVPEKLEKIDNSFGLKGLDSEPNKVKKSTQK